MRYRILPSILQEEAGHFQKLDQRWRPNQLLPEPYRRSLLKDIKRRYVKLFSALDELSSLERGDRYVRLVHRMRLYSQKASFAWRFDDQSFIQAIAGFYADYGLLLRWISIDQKRGKFKPSSGEEEGF